MPSDIIGQYSPPGNTPEDRLKRVAYAAVHGTALARADAMWLTIVIRFHLERGVPFERAIAMVA